jgi:uncharacterized repeat protein (TIGR01451 family)
MRNLTSVVFLIGLPLVAALAAPDIDVQKSTSNQFPVANEPVEFTLQVTNIGDVLAADVIVIDQLPVEMNIPLGTAAFVVLGFVAAIGAWRRRLFHGRLAQFGGGTTPATGHRKH